MQLSIGYQITVSCFLIKFFLELHIELIVKEFVSFKLPIGTVLQDIEVVWLVRIFFLWTSSYFNIGYQWLNFSFPCPIGIDTSEINFMLVIDITVILQIIRMTRTGRSFSVHFKLLPLVSENFLLLFL